MRKYLFCYYTEIHDECRDLEKIIEAYDFKEAVIKFDDSTIYKKIHSASEITNPDYIQTLINQTK